ncbi:MAG: nicotinate (nicotinamide) nucleotide adenylyltransferase [Candidatus Omnitrophota bacterium]
MKIGIFGGTFDPVHLGHLELAQNALAQFSLDKIIFVPALQPPHKQDAALFTSAKDRCEMVRLAIQGKPFLEFSDCEILRKGVSYTFDTVCEFEKKYPHDTLCLILGGDAFEGINTWHRADELKRKVQFLIARRGDHQMREPQDIRAEWIQMPPCSIASSAIREAIKCGKNVDDDVSPEVLHYIRVHALYQKS